jgi:hypothetical protein
MKFLVLGEIEYSTLPHNPQDSLMFAEHMVISHYQILEQWEKEGKLVGGNFTGQRKSAFILEASSNEEVADMLMKLPLWGNMKFEVSPLQSISSVIDESKKQVEGLKQVASTRTWGQTTEKAKAD